MIFFSSRIETNRGYKKEKEERGKGTRVSSLAVEGRVAPWSPGPRVTLSVDKERKANKEAKVVVVSRRSADGRGLTAELPLNKWTRRNVFVFHTLM